MALIALRCPQCGGEIQLESVREIGFCMYCGSKVVLQEALKHEVTVDESHKVDAWLALSYDALRSENLVDAEGYANKIIEINVKNPDAWYIKGCCASDAKIAQDQWNKALGYSEKNTPLWNTIVAAQNNLFARKISRNVTFIRDKSGFVIGYGNKKQPFYFFLNDIEQFELKNGESRTIMIEGGSYILKVTIRGMEITPPFPLDINKDMTVHLFFHEKKRIWEITTD
jgi:DNA-directed RNA polymerase subunit RPC12/RpoP